jgi:hypothetical protein
MDRRKMAGFDRKKREKAGRRKVGREPQKKGGVRNKVGTGAEKEDDGGKKVGRDTVGREGEMV